ncbi:MAG: cyclase family protein [Desulfobacterales bacterium]
MQKTYQRIYDISVILGQQAPDWPGDPVFRREILCRIEKDCPFELSALGMSSHSGTHIDMPSHFIPGGKNLDDYAARDFILPARVAEIADSISVTACDVQKLDIPPGSALLFKTSNSVNVLCVSRTFSETYVHLSPEAADICIEKKIRLAGIDYVSIEKYGEEDCPVHRKLLEKDILILEGINLKDVPAGDYTLLCLPLRIKAGEASPVRAVLLA